MKEDSDTTIVTQTTKGTEYRTWMRTNPIRKHVVVQELLSKVTGFRTWMQTNPKRIHVVVQGMSKLWKYVRRYTLNNLKDETCTH